MVPVSGMPLVWPLMFIAWFGGVKQSLLAVALSLLVLKPYFVTPIHSLAVATREIPRLLLGSGRTRVP